MLSSTAAAAFRDAVRFDREESEFRSVKVALMVNCLARRNEVRPVEHYPGSVEQECA